MLRRCLLLMVSLAGLATGQAQAAGPSAGRLWTEPVSGITFVWIPGGQYLQGCQSADGKCPEVELPVRERKIAGFWMSRTEVTRAQWAKLEAHDPSVATKPGDYPVDQVHWEEAQDFLARLDQTGHGHFRLPTEAEWEYACRGGVDGQDYCGSGAPDTLAWYNGNSRRSTQPVGGKQANGYGLFDMSGNLWEWTDDCWSQSLPDLPDGKPFRDQECAGHVLKGGSWGAYPPQLRKSSRRSDIDVKCPYIGLRVVKSAD